MTDFRLIRYVCRPVCAWMALAACGPFFFVGGPGYDGYLLFREFWNLGHVMFFGLFAGILDRRLARIIGFMPVRCAFVLSLVLFLAVSIEVMQAMLPGRISSNSDFLMGAGGGLIALLLVNARKKSVLTRYVFPVAGASILVIAMVPFLMTAYGVYRFEKMFPVLSDFESSADLLRWRGMGRLDRVNEPVYEGMWALKVALPPAKYSGVSLHHFSPDWSKARQLSFAVFNPSGPVKLHVRVHDAAHEKGRQCYRDRFNITLTIEPGWNNIRIPTDDISTGPKDRFMDMKEIKGLGMFLADNLKDRTLYIDDVRLVE